MSILTACEPVEAASEPGFANIQRQMQRMMDQMQKGFFNFCPSETWTPNVNLYENETTYIVCVDLSGVDKDRISVEVGDHKLTLRGAREVPVLPDGKAPEEHGNRYKVHLMEIDHGPFIREVELPENVAREKIAASHRNGLLWIELPKK
jgi:HSP20 family molecular chaperone IbpA